MVSAKFGLCIVWALLVGTSVTLQLCSNVVLNGHSSKPQLHALYTSNLSVLLGGVLLVPRCCTAPERCRRPKRWWSVLGGVFTLPAFLTIPASSVMGVQVVLLTQLLAMLGTALVFDLRRGRVRFTDYKRLSGFGVVLLGVVVETLGAGSQDGGGFSAEALLLLLGVFASGVGYALQAKCNGRLSRDLGSTARSTAFSAVVALLATLPLDLVFGVGLHVGLRVSATDWPLWLFVGFQSAFYIASLARLPTWLGYTTSYLVLLIGKLGSSSVADAVGLTGKVVPFGLLRGLALALVFAGTALFSAKGRQQEPEQVGSMISNLDPAFEPLDDEADLDDDAKLQERIAAAAGGPGTANGVHIAA